MSLYSIDVQGLHITYIYTYICYVHMYFVNIYMYIYIYIYFFFFLPTKYVTHIFQLCLFQTSFFREP